MHAENLGFTAYEHTLILVNSRRKLPATTKYHTGDANAVGSAIILLQYINHMKIQSTE